MKKTIIIFAVIGIVIAAVAAAALFIDRASVAAMRCRLMGGEVKPAFRSGFYIQQDECIKPLPSDAPRDCRSEADCRGGRCEFGDMDFPTGPDTGWCVAAPLFMIEK